MKNLNDIIVKKDQLISVAEKLGFNNLKIHYHASDAEEGEGVELNLMVNIKPQHSISWKNSTYLSVLLMKILDCQVKVIVFENLNELYKFHYETTSASINDEVKIRALFNNKSATMIEFKKIGDQGKMEMEIVEGEAEKALQDSEKNSIAEIVDANTLSR